MSNPLDLNLVNLLLFLHQNRSLITSALRKMYFKVQIFVIVKASQEF